MRGTWVIGAAVLFLAWGMACGGDSVTQASGGSAATTSTGGTGGSPATTTSTGGSPATTTSTGGSGGTFATDCDAACAKVDMCAGFAGLCGLIGIDCNDPQADCPADCVNDADCAAILSLAPGGTPDPTLEGCLMACDLGFGGAGGTGGTGGNGGAGGTGGAGGN